jgi:hypothetical protein
LGLLWENNFFGPKGPVMPRFLQSNFVLRRIALGCLALCLVACGANPAQPATISAQTAVIPAIIQTDLPGQAAGEGWWQSPDGQWLVEDMTYLAPASQKNGLRVVRADGKSEWKLDFLGMFSGRDAYRPAAWSRDGNFLYVEYSLKNDTGPTNMYCKTNGIKQIDLRSGSVKLLFEFLPMCWNFAFSPDVLQLAYVPALEQPLQLVVMDVNTGKQLTYTFDDTFSEAGLIQWSPDQKQLLVVASYPDGSAPEGWKSALFLIQIEGDALVAREIQRRSGFIFPGEWKDERVRVSASAESKADAWEVDLRKPTLTPTRTLTPSQTTPPTLTPTYTLTPTPSRTSTPNRKTLLAPTETIPAIILTEIPYADGPGYFWWHSPDGKWLVENQGVEHHGLQVVRVDGKFRWKVDFLGTQAVADDSYRPAAWSNDGNFVYIAYHLGLIDYFGLQYCLTNGIKRLDLRDGSITPFLEFNDTAASQWWNYTFSADALKLAYIPPTDPKQLVVLELNSGKKLTYKFDKIYEGAGLIQWSSDQKQLIMAASQPDTSRTTQSITPPVKSTLFWVKIENDALAVQEVFSEVDYLYPGEWKGDRVLVRQVDLFLENNRYWEVYLSSQMAIPIKTTSTPSPTP